MGNSMSVSLCLLRGGGDMACESLVVCLRSGIEDCLKGVSLHGGIFMEACMCKCTYVSMFPLDVCVAGVPRRADPLVIYDMEL